MSMGFTDQFQQVFSHRLIIRAVWTHPDWLLVDVFVWIRVLWLLPPRNILWVGRVDLIRSGLVLMLALQ